jgi:hypothetical protein
MCEIFPVLETTRYSASCQLMTSVLVLYVKISYLATRDSPQHSNLINR